MFDFFIRLFVQPLEIRCHPKYYPIEAKVEHSTSHHPRQSESEFSPNMSLGLITASDRPGRVEFISRFHVLDEVLCQTLMKLGPYRHGQGSFVVSKWFLFPWK